MGPQSESSALEARAIRAAGRGKRLAVRACYPHDRPAPAAVGVTWCKLRASTPRVRAGSHARKRAAEGSSVSRVRHRTGGRSHDWRRCFETWLTTPAMIFGMSLIQFTRNHTDHSTDKGYQ